MKKILFATTALVATAGVAQAEVAITGFAEIGILGGDRYITPFSPNDGVVQFHTDIDVTFTMTGEADNGLTFGAKVDLDENGAFGNTTQGGETYFIAYGGARLDMGDVDGAFDAALTEVAIGGSIADDHTTHAGYNGNAGFDGLYDGQIATLSYEFSGFTGYLSAEIDDSGNDDPIWGVGFKYSVDVSNATIGVGLGYQQTTINAGSPNVPTGAALGAANGQGDWSIWGISLDTTFDNGLQAIVNYSEVDGPGINGGDHTAIGIGYSMNAVTVGFNYGVFNFDSGAESKGWGLAANYDLGGGLEAQFGYGYSELTAAGGATFDTNQYSLGLAMSF